MKYLPRIQSLAERGVRPDDPKVIAFHGTSVEAIRALATRGALPVTRACGTQLHICPKDGTTYASGPLEEAKRYAGFNAIRSHILGKLRETGIIIPPIDMTGMTENLGGPFVIGDAMHELRGTIMKALGIRTVHDFDRFYRTLMQTRKGVLLGIRPSGLRGGKVSKGENEDIVLTFRGGLPIVHIDGIEPLGQFEWDQIVEKGLSDVTYYR